MPKYRGVQIEGELGADDDVVVEEEEAGLIIYDEPEDGIEEEEDTADEFDGKAQELAGVE